MEKIKKYEPLWGKWTVKRKIGEGSFGAVYEVESEKFGNKSSCAVKLISFKNVEILQGVNEVETLVPEELEKLKIKEARKNVREAVLMEKLQGRDHIVTIYDYDIFPGESTTDIIIRMELLTNLNEYMELHKTDSEEEVKNLVIKLGIDIGKALEECEEEKIVHRDIKPDNIFINKNGTFKLGDFGLSRKMNKSASFSLRKSAGTPYYMAPEALGWGNKTDYLSDIYSLGIVMYQLLNDGNIPFVSDMKDFVEVDDAIGKRVNRDEIIAPKHECGQLWEIIQKACQYKKEDRYQSAGEFRRELEKIENKVAEIEKKEEEEKEENTLNPEEILKELYQIKKELEGLKKQEYEKRDEDSQERNPVTKQYNVKGVQKRSETERQTAKQEYHVGENILFGRYPQNADGTGKPIEWTILEIKENRMLLLSKNILTNRKYHEKKKTVTWETSDIRRWLNEDFYNKAFNEIEKNAMQDVLIKTNNNYKCGTLGGNDTVDKVYLLSIEEVMKYFPNDDKQRIGKLTEYARKEEQIGVHNEVAGAMWRLRSPGIYGYRAAEITGRGFLDENGDNVTDQSGIRPVICIEKN